MNIATNQFETLPDNVEAPAGFIEFAIGEVLSLKGYDFKIIKVTPNRLHLSPVGLTNRLTLANPINKDSLPEKDNR